MTISPKSSNLWTRRKSLLALGGAISLTVPFAAHAHHQDLHRKVANCARDLRKGQDVELNILLPQGSEANVKPVADAFHELTGVNMAITTTPVDDINTELTLQALSGASTYDVALPASFGLPDLASSGAILPLSDYAHAHEPPGFRQRSLYRVGDSFDSQVFGFQADGDVYLMFYNKRFLSDPDETARFADQFGYPLEKPATWGELDRQMDFFNRPEKGQWGGLLFRSPGYLAWEWWGRFHAKGIWPFSADMEPQIACDSGVEALEELIRATDSLHPSVRELGLFENWSRYSQGDIYCNIGWGGSQKYLNGESSPMRSNMVYGKLPGGNVDGAMLETPYFNWGWHYVVPSHSAYPEISYLFTLFASSPEMSTLSVRQMDGFFDPHRPEHYQDAGILKAYTAEFLDVHRSSLETAMPDLYLRGQSEYFRVLNNGLDRALMRDVTPEAALTRIARRWQLTTESIGRRAQIKRWKSLKARYPAALRRSLKDPS